MAQLILVTGGAGFVGSHLCARLAKEGKRVISLDNYFAGSERAHVEGVEYRRGHTKDIATLVPEIPEIIFHLGEYARVEQSLLEPDVVHDLNVIGTAAVIEYWRTRKCKLLYAGSSTKFGDAGLARDRTPYARTKAANTEKVREIGEREGLPYAVTYFYNVYGPGERGGIYGTVIEWFKEMYLRGEPIAVVSPGTQTRNFTHVDDIVDALVEIGDKGHGDEYGIGNERAYTMREVARLFGDDIVMLPERKGNRMSSELHADKTKALGWNARRDLEEYVRNFVDEHQRGEKRERRVLVLSTTFYPVEGPAEAALRTLAERMPDVQFDVVTSAFGKDRTVPPARNVTIYRVGMGSAADKYLLPILGLAKAYALHRQRRYLFAWSLMASYAALLGVLLKRVSGLPLLVTFADQDLSRLGFVRRFFFARVVQNADQVYGFESQEKHAEHVKGGKLLRRSIGAGDAFANQLRYAYAEILMGEKKV